MFGVVWGFLEMISVKRVSLFSCTVLISGCASVATNTNLVKPAQSVIAQDFVRTMAQIDDLDPSSTVLHFLPPANESSMAFVSTDCTTEFFGLALRDAATEGGYKVQTAYSVPGNISFSVSQFDKENEVQGCVYDLTVGDIDFRRVYQYTNNGKVIPRQSMLVRGVDVSNIELDDSIFDLGDDKTTDSFADNSMRSEDIESSGLTESLLSATSKQTTAINTDSEFDSPVARNDIERRNANARRSSADLELLIVKPGKTPVENANASISPEDEAKKLGVTIDSISEDDATVEISETSARNSNGFVNVRKKNIAELGLSNFEEELADKKNVAEEILIFGDDSYVLGARNKQLLGDMVNSFNPETDVVSVVGCSTGVTQIEHGNAALAIGRANRVKEALLYSGVPHDKIFEEGCWSPTPNSTPFPNRGVVITVKRAADAG